MKADLSSSSARQAICDRQRLRSRPVALLPICVLIAMCGCAHTVQLKPFAGMWALKQEGKNVMVLNTHQSKGALVGEMVLPTHFTEEPSGRFSGISPETEHKKARAVPMKSGASVLMLGKKPDRDSLPMILIDPDHLGLRWANGSVPDWQFVRLTGNTSTQYRK